MSWPSIALMAYGFIGIALVLWWASSKSVHRILCAGDTKRSAAVVVGIFALTISSLVTISLSVS